MPLKETEYLNQGAKFVLVTCGGKGCYGKMGDKWLFYEHNGYESTNAPEVSQEQVDRAIYMANRHDKKTHHEMRIVIGK